MEQLTWAPVVMQLETLLHWNRNPRLISKVAFDQLKAKIQARGFHDVLKVDLDGVVLSGNQRLEALKDLGVTEVNCLVPNRALTESEREKVALESNRSSGEWDIDALGSFEQSVLEEVGFTPVELARAFDLDGDGGADSGESEKPGKKMTKAEFLRLFSEEFPLYTDPTREHVYGWLEENLDKVFKK